MPNVQPVPQILIRADEFAAALGMTRSHLERNLEHMEVFRPRVKKPHFCRWHFEQLELCGAVLVGTMTPEDAARELDRRMRRLGMPRIAQ